MVDGFGMVLVLGLLKGCRAWGSKNATARVEPVSSSSFLFKIPDFGETNRASAERFRASGKIWSGFR